MSKEESFGVLTWLYIINHNLRPELAMPQNSYLDIAKNSRNYFKLREPIDYSKLHDWTHSRETTFPILQWYDH